MLWASLALVTASCSIPACDRTPPPPPASSVARAPSEPAAAPTGPLFDAVADVALGDLHTCASRRDGSVWCWGDGSFDQLGDEAPMARSTPGRVEGLGDVAGISAGAVHTCARTKDGSVRCWGRNGLGQLGDGTKRRVVGAAPPIRIPPVEQVALSVRSCAVLRDRTVTCWGNTDWSLGAESASLEPVELPGLEGVAEISLGFAHGCARLADGTVRCWGNNVLGACGDGDAGPHVRAPIAVKELNDVIGIALGSGHSCALGKDGRVRCWGSNKEGELGDGTHERRATPVLVSDLHDVTQIAAGADHSCARTEEGGVACWGSNEFGQLGDGTTEARARPTPVTGLTEVTRVALGANHSCAVRSDGSLLCWGRNDSGQLGSPRTGSCSRTRPSPCALRPVPVTMQPR